MTTVSPNAEISIPLECEILEDAKTVAREFEEWYLEHRSEILGEHAPLFGTPAVRQLDSPGLHSRLTGRTL